MWLALSASVACTPRGGQSAAHRDVALPLFCQALGSPCHSREVTQWGFDIWGEKAWFGSFRPWLLEWVAQIVFMKSYSTLNYFSSSWTQRSLKQYARKTVVTASHLITPGWLMITEFGNQPRAFSTGSSSDTISLLSVTASNFHH